MAKNPPWHRDEIIIALDLYFKMEPGEIHAKNPAIIEVSDILNLLPIFDVRPDEVKFRNPNGVGLKLSNFLAIDPSYPGKGMSSYSKLDEKIFFEFNNNRKLLGNLADAIKATVSNPELNFKLYSIGPDEENFEVMEGQVIYRLHKYFERNSSIVGKKKSNELKLKGVLECEACSFDYKKAYGEIGNGYMECHHRTPLYQLDSKAKTTLDDLALVCASCHRMLHRGTKLLEVGELKEQLKQKPIIYSFSNQ